MNKYKYLLLFISILLLPVIVHGEECNPGSISITGIELESIEGKAKEISSPTVDNNKINLDLKLNEVGDTVEYNININNSSNEDYYFDKDIIKDTSEYVDYSLEYDSNIVEANSIENVKLKVEYKNEVPPVDGDSLELDDTKELNLFLSNNNEIGVPNTGINIKSLIITISLLIVISLALYKTNKKTYILIGTILLLPTITNAICKANIEINSSIKIARPVPVTETIYWALQDNDMDDLNETLVISSEEVDGILKGNIPGDSTFLSYSLVPWITSNYYYDNNNLSYNVTNVKIEGIVAPTSTAYWFYSVGYRASTFEADLSNLVTNNVTNMSYMFNYAGSNATTWSVKNISNWDTSKVTNMSNMFAVAGNMANNFNLDLSNWNTLNVTDMSSMLAYAGQSATNWSIGDISNWDTSKVTNMANMFDSAGHSSTSWSIGDINNWDTSNVTYMEAMFRCVGQNTTTFSLDLSNWDTSKVTNMSSMFNGTAFYATTFILNISNWDTSKVKDMSYMFYNVGNNSSDFNLDLSNWDTSNVTSMPYMFSYAGYNSSNFNLDLSSWNTSQVTYMSQMFYNAGKKATSWQVTIPQTNGNGIDNTTSMMYGNSNSKYATPDTGKSFALAE